MLVVLLDVVLDVDLDPGGSRCVQHLFGRPELLYP